MYTTVLTHIKNAQAVGKEQVKVPYSKFDEAVLTVLAQEKFVAGVEKKGKNPKRYLEITLAYKNGAGVIHGVKLASTPSRHLYTPYAKIPLVKQGYGCAIISTSQGIKTGKNARKEKTGGELLFTIW